MDNRGDAHKPIAIKCEKTEIRLWRQMRLPPQSQPAANSSLQVPRYAVFLILFEKLHRASECTPPCRQAHGSSLKRSRVSHQQLDIGSGAAMRSAVPIIVNSRTKFKKDAIAGVAPLGISPEVDIQAERHVNAHHG